MDKLKVGVIFGGKSTEHDVSIVSGTSVIKNLNKEKYEVLPIYIDENGEWYIYNKDVDCVICISDDRMFRNAEDSIIVNNFALKSTRRISF